MPKLHFRNRTTLLLCTCVFLLLSLSAVCRAANPVVMKVLVLAGSSNEKSYRSISTVLDQIGVPHQSLLLNSIPADGSGNRLAQLSLSDTTNGQGLYQGIIVSDNTFGNCGASCLSQSDWTKLNTYAAQFNVRVVSYFTSPAAQWGLLPADAGATYKAAQPLNVSLTPAGAAVFSYLNSANSVSVAGQGTTGIKAYLATTVAASNEVTTPLLTAGTSTVAVTHTAADGRETMALTMDNDPTLLHSIAFGYGVVNWVTKGVFLGSRRVYLNPQFDDILNGNWIYAPSRHPACESNNTCPTYFQTGPDLQALANWQSNLQTDPQFQGYRTTFAYNGVGTEWFDPSEPIFDAVKSLNAQFWWVSHTWDHADLDCYAVTQNGSCIAATQAQSLSELNRNIAVAPQLGITLDKLGMVTPFNGGLANINFLRAAAQVGIKYIAIPQLPATPNTPIVNPLLPSIIEITRIKNNLFDDASSPFTGVSGSWTDEYNAQYGPRGATPLYSQNQTYSQIVDSESQVFLLNNMLTYAPYLMAFHISNEATYDGVHSIFTDTVDAAVSKYKKLFTLPVSSMTMEDIGAAMINRAAFNASGVTGVYTPGVNIVLTTTKAAAIPLTGVCSQAQCGAYGGQIQDNVVMAANSTVTIPMNGSVGVSLSGVTVNPTSVVSGTSAAGAVTLSGPAPTGGVPVSLTSGTAEASVPASITVASGSTSATFSVSTSAVTVNKTATITASYNGISKTASLTITPAAAAAALASITLNPASVTGGAGSTGTVTLTAAAPAGGIAVSLTSGNTAAVVPASVIIPSGSTTAVFAVSTTAVSTATTVTITAGYNNVTKTAALAVVPPAALSIASVALTPTSITSGSTATGTVSLSAAAPSGGVTVALSSNMTSVTVPAAVTIVGGSTSASFSVSASSVAYITAVTITASLGGTAKTAALTVNPLATVALSAVAVNPTSVVNQLTATGTVTLSTVAPAGGIVVSLWTTGAIGYVPESVTIAAGSTTANFTITTNYTTTTKIETITAFYNGASKTANLTVNPLKTLSISSVAVNPTSVVNQLTGTGTVTLDTVAPAGGVVVSLWTTGAIAYVPASVTIAAGSTTAGFTITTNYTTTAKTETITAFYNGTSKTATLTVTP